MTKSSLLVSLLAVLFASGCATLFQGTNEEIMVASDPAGAQVSINDGRQGTTPYSMRVNRNDDLQIHVSKPGYSSTDIADTSHVEWGYLVSDIFFTGLIGLAVDGIDGAMFYHNQAMVSAHLDPITPVQSDAAAGAPPAPAASVPAISRTAAIASDQPTIGSKAVVPTAAVIHATTAVNPSPPSVIPATAVVSPAPAPVNPAAAPVTPTPEVANPAVWDQMEVNRPSSVSLLDFGRLGAGVF